MSAPQFSASSASHPAWLSILRTPAGGPGPGTRAAALALVLSAHALILALVLTRAPAEILHVTPPMIVSLLAPSNAPTQAAAPQAAPASPPHAAPPAVPPTRSLPRPPTAKPAPVAAPDAGVAPPAANTPAPSAPEASPPATPPTAAAATSGAAPTGPASSGTISPARYDAAYLNNQTPYPPMARRLGETGTVKLRVLISAEGLAEKIELVSSSGSPRLDEGAQVAVRRWRFVPARQGDQPVASVDIIPIVFTLKEQ